MKGLRRLASCECADCHYIVPKNQAVSTVEERKSGRVGWGLSVSSKTDGTGGRRSVSSGRNLYINKTIWLCQHCHQIRSTERAAGVASVIALFVSILLAGHGSDIGWRDFALAFFKGTWVTLGGLIVGGASVVAYMLWRDHFRLVHERDRRQAS